MSFKIVNFIVSGYSAHKYFSTGKRDDDDAPLNEREPHYLVVIEMLLRYHWGSVAGGSLLLGFFYFVDLLLDFIFVINVLFSRNPQRSMSKMLNASLLDMIDNLIIKTVILKTQLDSSI